MSSISQVYSQFRACGQIGQDRASHMNRALDVLKSEPNFGEKLATVRTTYNHKEKNKAIFVQAVLNNYDTGIDPSFETLHILNRALNLFERASKADKSKTRKQLEAVKKCYFSLGRVDGYTALLQTLGCSAWQTSLPSDVAGKIISFLSLKDHFAASATCSAWYRAACRPHSFTPTFLPQEIPFISSFTTSLTRAAFLAQRQRVEAAATLEPSDKLLLRPCTQEAPVLYNREPGDPIIFHSEHAIGVVCGNRRFTIAHDFNAEYKLLSAASLHKIFVVNQDNTHLQSIHEIDTTTGAMTTLYSEAIEATVDRLGYRDNKLWLLDTENRLRSFDLATGKLTVEAESIQLTPSGAGLANYKQMLRIFTSDGPTATFATEDLTNLAAGAHPIPNTQNTTRFTTITDRVLYASYQPKMTVTAFDRTTGDKLKDYPHSKLSSFWLTPGALISEGFLYLAVSYKTTEVYDLLTSRLIRTITFEGTANATEIQAIGNKIIYTQDSEIRIKQLG